MSLTIVLALAVQAAGQEITTFHPLPPQAKDKQARQQVPVQPVEPAAAVAPTADASEKIEVLSVSEVPADANVRFVPPPPSPPPH